jgi:RNA:NAD 2'-phosphotransferase (TPT1/KptA family)
MPTPPGHTVIPVTKDGLLILETLLGIKFTISKRGISRLHLQLRHSDDIDNCDTGGFFPASYILRIYKTTIDRLVNNVYHNNKNRFEFSVYDGDLYVRACQGHSGKILEKLIPEHIYNVYTSDVDVFHRTTHAVLEKITSTDDSSNGLRPIGRQVHMATNDELSRNKDAYPIKININVSLARSMGVTFYHASNGVILSYNKIPLECLSY